LHTFNVDYFLQHQEDGIDLIMERFPKFKFGGKGYESHDLRKLMQAYRQWALQLFPNLHFNKVVKKLERFGSTKKVQDVLRHKRLKVAEFDKHEFFVGSSVLPMDADGADGIDGAIGQADAFGVVVPNANADADADAGADAGVAPELQDDDDFFAQLDVDGLVAQYANQQDNKQDDQQPQPQRQPQPQPQQNLPSPSNDHQELDREVAAAMEEMHNADEHANAEDDVDPDVMDAMFESMLAEEQSQSRPIA
jgi:Replication Fork Protection Component Swi3